MDKKKQPDPASLNEVKREEIEKAHKEADRDISADPELSAHSPNDDLDEEESARLGEDKTDLV
jgi:hypothetical protein